MNEGVTIAVEVPTPLLQSVGGAAGGVLAVVLFVILWRRRRRTKTAPNGSVPWLRALIDHRRAKRHLARAAESLSTLAAAECRSKEDLDARIEALLSLGSLAQDTARRGAWQVHVTVLSLLCRYVRDVAPSQSAVDFPLAPWQGLPDGATAAEKAAHLAWREVRFANRITPNARAWAASLPPPRADVALALRIIGRGIPDEIPDRPGAPRAGLAGNALPCPTWPDTHDQTPPTAEAIARYRTALHTWRTARAAAEGFRPDLRRTNLQAADLSGLGLSGCRLDGARLEGAKLCATRLDGASLRDARLDGADLTAARLPGADLRRASLEAAVLRGAQMQGARLRKARMEWVNAKQARLDGADLHEARLEVASFYQASLIGAVFYKATIDGAVLRGARLDGADFTRARLPWANLRNARLDHAALCWATLEDADLSEAVLDGADLFKARLDRADLRRAHLIGVILFKAGTAGHVSLSDAIFQQTVLARIDLGTVTITQSQIDQCLGDASVVLPEGIAAPDHWSRQVAPTDPPEHPAALVTIRQA
jgi:uncharacterized protein YjbI with pentapeptide repeats